MIGCLKLSTSLDGCVFIDSWLFYVLPDVYSSFGKTVMKEKVNLQCSTNLILALLSLMIKQHLVLAGNVSKLKTFMNLFAFYCSYNLLCFRVKWERNKLVFLVLIATKWIHIENADTQIRFFFSVFFSFSLAILEIFSHAIPIKRILVIKELHRKHVLRDMQLKCYVLNIWDLTATSENCYWKILWEELFSQVTYYLNQVII